MAMIALCFPILPGKKDKWQEMAAQLSKEPLKSKLNATRAAAGVHERTYLQETPKGDLVIVTLEGATPFESFMKMVGDPSLAEFNQWVAEVHGLDPSGPPPAPPKLVYDSKA
jgi:hypothetical protein